MPTVVRAAQDPTAYSPGIVRPFPVEDSPVAVDVDAARADTCPDEAEPGPVEGGLVDRAEHRVRRVGRVAGEPPDVGHRAASEVRVLTPSRVLAEGGGRGLEPLSVDAERHAQLLEGLG